MTDYKKTKTEEKLCYIVDKLAADAVKHLPASEGQTVEIALGTFKVFIDTYGIEELYKEFKNQETLH